MQNKNSTNRGRTQVYRGDGKLTLWNAQVRVTFQLGDFQNSDMFWRTADDIVVELRQSGFTVRGWAKNEQAGPTESPTMQAQSPVTTDRKIALTGLVIGIAVLVVAILTCIAAYLVIPQVQTLIQILVNEAAPTTMPIYVTPTPTPSSIPTNVP